MNFLTNFFRVSFSPDIILFGSPMLSFTSSHKAVTPLFTALEIIASQSILPPPTSDADVKIFANTSIYPVMNSTLLKKLSPVLCFFAWIPTNLIRRLFSKAPGPAIYFSFFRWSIPKIYSFLPSSSSSKRFLAIVPYMYRAICFALLISAGKDGSPLGYLRYKTFQTCF